MEQIFLKRRLIKGNELDFLNGANTSFKFSKIITDTKGKTQFDKKLFIILNKNVKCVQIIKSSFGTVEIPNFVILSHINIRKEKRLI